MPRASSTVDVLPRRLDVTVDPFFRRTASSTRLDDPALQMLAHSAFKRTTFYCSADESNRLLSLIATVEVYFVQDPAKMSKALLIGTISYSGRLLFIATAKGEPTWSPALTANCLYNESNSKKLPDLLKQFGPGAFITAVAQTLFGTLEGKRLLGLEKYTIPGLD